MLHITITLHIDADELFDEQPFLIGKLSKHLTFVANNPDGRGVHWSNPAPIYRHGGAGVIGEIIVADAEGDFVPNSDAALLERVKGFTGSRADIHGLPSALRSHIENLERTIEDLRRRVAGKP